MTMLGAPEKIRGVRLGVLEDGAVFMFIRWKKALEGQ
jgi:hypothetical protein